MKRLKLLACVSLIFNFQFSIFNLATAQNTRYETDSTCGCDILYIDGIQTTRDGDRYGFRRDDGFVVAPNIYHHVGSFTDGYCRVWLEDTLCGLLSASGEVVVPCIYDNVDQPYCGRVLITKNGLSGFSDLHGNEVIPPTFVQAAHFTENRAPVVVPIDSFFYRCTFIDTMGNVLFEPVFESALSFSNGYAPVKQYERWGLIDTLGRVALPTIYEQITPLGDGIFFAGDDYGMALINTQQLTDNNLQLTVNTRPSLLTEPVYVPVTGVGDNRIGVARSNKMGFLDLKGREVIPCIYDEIGVFKLGRTLVRVGDKYGIIDTLGKVILPIEYDYKSTKGNKYVYHDSLALVERNGLLGYVDLEGREVIPLRFEEAYHFSEGLAPVLFNGLWGYIDTKGDIFLPFIFDIASPFRWGRAEVFLRGNRHKIDLEGHCLTNCNGIISFR